MRRAIGLLIALCCVAGPATCLPRSQNDAGQQTQASRNALTNQDVLDMLKAGLSPEIVVAKIKASACNFDTSPAVLEALKKAGVSNDVILAIVQAPVIPTAPMKGDASDPLLKAEALSKDVHTPADVAPRQKANSTSGSGICTVYFSVVLQDDAVPGGFALGMDKYQADWWSGGGGADPKKYSGLCYLADPRDARVEYLLVYSAGERVTPPAQTVYAPPSQITCNTSALSQTTSRTNCATDTETGGGFAGGVIKGYTDTVERTAQRRKVAYLSVFHLAVAPSGNRSLDPAVAIYVAQEASMSGLITRALSHPTRGVLEDGVNFIAGRRGQGSRK